jgi:DNA-binding Xre family transcriptional regulator
MKPEKLDISKYFWDLNRDALEETRKIFKNVYHPKFIARLTNLLSRCDKPKELFSLISKNDFLEIWPKTRSYWIKIERNSDFRDWWQTIYEGILSERQVKIKSPAGKSPVSFVAIGKIIREARVNRSLSQHDLAIKTRMKQPDISKIEEGKKNITLQTLLRLCKILEIKKIEI